MLPNYAISDADWERTEHLLPGRSGQRGGVAEDSRRFLGAVLWIARTWADRPKRPGKGNAHWRRFDRWAKAGRRDPIPAPLRARSWTS